MKKESNNNNDLYDLLFFSQKSYGLSLGYREQMLSGQNSFDKGEMIAGRISFPRLYAFF